MDSNSQSSTKKKTITQGIKERFSVLRHNNDSPAVQPPTTSSSTFSLLSASNKDRVKPTAEMVSLWLHSFDNLLHDKIGLELFREYLRLEFSEENLEFWIACEEYKTTNPNELHQQAQQIFSDYVAIQAPREINLDSKTRDNVYNQISKPDSKTFEDAQYRIQALMAKDSYPRFMASEFLKKWLAQFKIKINQNKKK